MADGPKAAVSIRSVSKIYGAGESAVTVLDRVTFDIRDNEFFTLLGPSGCGKTTLLRLIAGFDVPTSGEIRLYGEPIGELPPYKRPVNTVFQSYALFPHMTVAENIAFGLEMLRRPRAEIRDRVETMLRLVRMEELRDRRTSQISGGQQQRVALARALAPSPKVLLLDEPLSALDYKLRKDMQIELKRLQHETGITFIFVTHDQEEALTMSDRIAVMSAGRILQVGVPREVYDHPSERFVADFIGETNFLEGVVVAAEADLAQVRLPSGATVSAAHSGDARAQTSVTLAVRPEHAEIAPPGAPGALAARVDNVVYFGTDTHYHLMLEGGGPFIVRRQNSRGAAAPYAAGDAIAVRLQPGAAQLLKD
jgi:spermidine/putrescine transport system ATP-binding protein